MAVRGAGVEPLTYEGSSSVALAARPIIERVSRPRFRFKAYVPQPPARIDPRRSCVQHQRVPGDYEGLLPGEHRGEDERLLPGQHRGADGGRGWAIGQRLRSAADSVGRALKRTRSDTRGTRVRFTPAPPGGLRRIQRRSSQNCRLSRSPRRPVLSRFGGFQGEVSAPADSLAL